MTTNIFETFQGADLSRLVACIQAVEAAGLSIDKYAQAGINQSSSNVYIWSEDWQGCVACSIGFDVAWWYSCPECGDEFEFESYDDLCEYADKYGDQYCETCAADADSDD